MGVVSETVQVVRNGCIRTRKHATRSGKWCPKSVFILKWTRTVRSMFTERRRDLDWVQNKSAWKTLKIVNPQKSGFHNENKNTPMLADGTSVLKWNSRLKIDHRCVCMRHQLWRQLWQQLWRQLSSTPPAGRNQQQCSQKLGTQYRYDFLLHLRVFYAVVVCMPRIAENACNNGCRDFFF